MIQASSMDTLGLISEIKKKKWFAQNAHISEYPGCIFENKKQLDTRHCMYGYSGKWVKKSENRLEYRIPKSAGQCGSPIYIKVAQNSYSVVGIQTDGDITSKSGLLINTQIQARLNQWINKTIIKKVTVTKNDMQRNGEIKLRFDQKRCFPKLRI